VEQGPYFDEENWSRIVSFVREERLTDIWINPGFLSGRKDGELVRLDKGSQEDTDDLIRQLFYERLDLLAELENPMPSIDFTVVVLGMRLRVKVFTAQKKLCSAIRVLPDKPPSPEEIDLDPMVLERICNAPNGFVLVTGQTGSGKTTTLAAIVNRINATRAVKIITIEHPIEYVFVNDRAEITQREIGLDCPSFAQGLEDALRQNPDIILCGEIIDEASALIALKAAETGHLVFSTLHTSGVSFSINRLINMLPQSYPEERARSVISASLLAVIDQRLCRRREGGRIAAREICLVNTAVQAKIRQKQEESLVDTIRSSRGEGMIDLNSYLDRIRHLIAPEEYLRYHRKLAIGR
jgi:twitching motility protein PilT